MGAKSCRYFWAVDSMWLNKKNEKKTQKQKSLDTFDGRNTITEFHTSQQLCTVG